MDTTADKAPPPGDEALGTRGGGNEEQHGAPEPPQAQPTPIANAILSQAVTTAMSQLDTKLAFDMMLLNEQMTTLEAERRCLREEVTFLKTRVAQQTHETNEMYQYFHGKLDHHVATIEALEGQLAGAREEMTQLGAAHDEALAHERAQFAHEREQHQHELERLQDELRQLHAFAVQKKALEDEMHALQEELAAKTRHFAVEKNQLELKAIFEKDRMKKDLLTRMQETKEELLLRTEDQLNTTTKRTMMENDHFMEELAFQSRETERLLTRYRLVEEEVKQLRVKTKILEENELVMAKKNHYYQRIVSQLRKGGAGSHSDAKAVGPDDADLDGDRGVLVAELKLQRTELAAAKEREAALEEQLRHAQGWIEAFQREKQFVVAQQDEIIQFLCRAIHEAAAEARRRAHPLTPRRHHDEVASLATSVHTLDELMTHLPSIAVDELSSEDTRLVLDVLLEKMRAYQQQLAVVYKGAPSVTSPRKSVDPREALAKQLGIELPPIAVASPIVTSPLKVKRRMHPTSSATSSTKPPNQTGKVDTTDGGGVSRGLLLVASTSFNFLPSSPAKGLSNANPSSKKSPSVGPTAHRRPPPPGLERLSETKPIHGDDESVSAWSTTTAAEDPEATNGALARS